MELFALLSGVIIIVRKAGEAIMAIYDSGSFGVETQVDDSPLTKADLAANQIIVNGLSSLPDKFPTLSEESGYGTPLHYNKQDLLNSHFMVAGNPPYPWRNCLEK
ncbi:MAG: hypothetical protein Q7T29_03665 [Gallionella sp.]|nr:hypothetical protein [Gallionella sp.]